MSRILKPEGIRGIAMSELSCELMMHIGRAAAQALCRRKRAAAVFYVAYDARRSAGALEAALCAGICAGGGNVHRLGLLPAGAAAQLIAAEEADFGFVLTAGDLPYEYNGLRLCNEKGLPSDAEQLAAIESLMPASAALPAKSHRLCGVIDFDIEAVQRWHDLMEQRFGRREIGAVRIAVDCANGAASNVAGVFFFRQGVTALVRSARPDGLNINRDCGTDALAETVREQHCDAGFALDGAGSSCIAVDETGELLDEGRMLAILCQARLDSAENGETPDILEKGVAVTARTNLGFLRYAEAKGIPVHRALSAEHSVLDLMRERGLPLGAGGKGIICFAGQPAADGLTTAAEILRIMRHTGRQLSALAAVAEAAPQVSVPVMIPPQWREIWRNDPEIAGYITECERALGENGRLLIREHPQKSMLTVTLEGSDFRHINTLALTLAEQITKCTPVI